MHSFSFLLSWWGSWWQQAEKINPRFSIPSSCWEIHRHYQTIERCNFSSWFWVCPEVSVQWDKTDTALPGTGRGASSLGVQITSTGSSRVRVATALLWGSPWLPSSSPIAESKSSNPTEMPHLPVWLYSFGHYPQRISRGEDRDVGY